MRPPSPQEEDMGTEAQESSKDLQSPSEGLTPYDEAMERDSDDLGSMGEEEIEGSGKQAKESEGGKSGQSGSGRQQNGGNDMQGGGPSSSGEGRGKEQEEEGLTAVGGQGLRGSRAASKGPAVINQQNLYKHFLETRILLQKVVLRSNETRLRPPDACAPKTKSAQRALAGTASQALLHLMQVHDALLDQSQAPKAGHGSQSQPALASAEGEDLEALSSRVQQSLQAGPAGAQGSTQGGSMTDDLWQVLTRRFEASASMREAAMERWQSRTVFQQQQGAVGASGKPFRAFNQRALEDKSRKSPAAGPDGESFDDSSFYSQLLKEFLEASGGLSNVAALNSTKGVKKHRNVDRRASKSRRLRFHVQEKLVNFMVPVPQEPPAFASQLFANLFGFDR
ncbi:apoptosis-antagonizing transcription factor [Dunaliella salina]|uniref:Apoptosis-antagonizing transcription factor n=1 Tax=Dunaliella salina TaxID=3046 RepID=A0ABQ7H3R8_DUNSA|nr:apoptosis-antagonizing transcription factor [Dunaliella salina]|eukprot:KAF5841508.1 apoptosis-antagonizing transcription factor [Dunaliella salina]